MITTTLIYIVVTLVVYMSINDTNRKLDINNLTKAAGWPFVVIQWIVNQINKIIKDNRE